LPLAAGQLIARFVGARGEPHHAGQFVDPFVGVIVSVCCKRFR
jgi:hypothetical protein